MKNIRLLFYAILALAVLAGIAVAKYPTHEGLDIQGGMRVVLQAEVDKLPPGAKWTSDQLDMVTEIMRRRVDALGVSEPQVYPMPAENRIVVELPGVKDKAQALSIIESTAKLEFRYLPELDNGTWTTADMTGPNGQRGEYQQIINASTGKPVSPEELQARVFSNPPILDGAQLKPNSRAELDQYGKSIVRFEFQDGEPKNTFEAFTRSHLKKRLAVFLDQKLITAPVINDVLPGEGIIEGNFTPESAKTLASQLNAGALPVPLQQLQLTNVEATLGRQAVHQTLIAGIVGLGLVLLFMLWWYRLPGLLADIALCLYTLFTFALFKVIPVTLTVPGIAGFILSIGMAVDANILIFERMKEERRAGKSLRSAVDVGFKRAFTAIFDSNVCTLITCGILYNFGTGQVRGFALTLAIGVIVSFFTAVTVTRTFLFLVANTKAGQSDAAYALTGGAHPHLQVTKRMALWFGLSALVIIPGMIAWGLGGIKKSIEFTGGTEITAQFTGAPNPNAIRTTLAAAGHKDSRVLVAEGNKAFITMTAVNSDADRQKVQTAIEGLGARVEGFSTVKGQISSELEWNAIKAVIYASVLIILYLALRFSLPRFLDGLKFGTCAVIALLHDVAVLWGSFAILGLLFNWQIDSLFVTGLLTVIGFSVHDTIVIFDRLRENLHHKQRGESFSEVADRSIEQTFARSVYTSFTVALTLVALLIFGGPTLRGFVTALLIGVVTGTYSSIFNATPLLVLWRRLTGDTSMGLAAAPVGAPSARPAPRKVETSRPSGSVTPAAAVKATATKAAAGARAAANGSAVSAGDAGAPNAAPAPPGPARLQPKKRKRRM